ncbi:MAG TPA: DUF3656 domain-containing protein, partial [Thermoleophilia bacterium]|nr:DUF3656 domain-containing protein [Thermoleophilia bacterium]
DPGPSKTPTREPRGDRVVLRLRERVGVKDRVFRTSSGEIGGLAADAVAGRALARPVPLSATLTGAAGERPRLVLRGDGEEAAVVGEAVLERARTAALTVDKARQALGALGGTPYELVDLEFRVEGSVFMAVGDLKALRRRAVAELDERRLARRRRTAAGPAAAPLAAATVVSTPAEHGSAPTPPSVGGGSSAKPKPSVVLRLRPGEDPFTWRHVDAVCFDLRTGDNLTALAAATARARERGVGVRVRSPEILFDADAAWARATAALPWDAVYARHPAALGWSDIALLEYPLAGLNAVAAHRLSPAGVVASPELSLDELRRFAAILSDTADDTAGADQDAPGPAPLLELLVFGREQVLISRDTLGAAEGVAGLGSQSPATPQTALLTDAKDFVFPVAIAPGETRIFNARVTNLCGHLGELAEVGAGGCIVVQADLSPDERDGFAAAGLEGLAHFDDRGRHTTGHLFRGVV